MSRTASALDAASRTLGVEARVPNAEHPFRPGMDATVTLPLTAASAGSLVPATALIIGEQCVKVASLGEDGRAHLLPVQNARDRGSEIELAGGLTWGEHIVVDPRPSLREGALLAVRVGGPA